MRWEIKMEEKKYTQKEFTNAIRSAIEDRATWFYLLLKEAEEEGLNQDELAKKAITRYGKIKGENFINVRTARDFATKLLGGNNTCAFDMEKLLVEEDRVELKFGHCALYEAWKKLGCTSDEIENLCKMANYGDYGILSCTEGLNLEFPKMQAKGDDYCHVVITKK